MLYCNILPSSYIKQFNFQELLKLYFTDQGIEKIELFSSKFPQNERNIVNTMFGSRYIFIEPILVKKKHDKIG